MTTYLGYDVLETKPDRPGAVPEGTARAHESLESETGERWTDVLEPAPVADIVYHWPCVGRAAALAQRQWIDARKGILVPFWLPTWMADVTLAEDALLGATEISILPIEYSALVWPASNARRHLAVNVPGKPVSYHYVSAAEDEGDHETLTLSPALPVDSPAATTKLSFLRFVRLAELDRQAERIWRGGHYCSSAIKMVEIPREAPAAT